MGRNHDGSGNTMRTLNEIQARIRSLYHSQTRLFTRESIETLKKQLGVLEGKCGTVSVKGLDGRVVEMSIETGSVSSCHQDREYVLYGFAGLRAFQFTKALDH